MRTSDADPQLYCARDPERAFEIMLVYFDAIFADSSAVNPGLIAEEPSSRMLAMWCRTLSIKLA